MYQKSISSSRLSLRVFISYTSFHHRFVPTRVAASPYVLNTSPSCRSYSQATMASGSSGVLGLDRKAMEAERIARLTKKRPASEISEPPAKIMRIDKAAEPSKSTPAAAKGRPMKRKNHPHDATPLHSPSYTPSRPDDPIQYPHGVMKKTWCYGFARGTDFKIEEVLQR